MKNLSDEILFSKTSDKAKFVMKRDEDAGYDLYPCFDEDYIVIYPNSFCIVPTGLKTAFPSNAAALVKERSSLGNLNIGLRGGVIDSGYRGEIRVTLSNHNSNCYVIITKKQSLDAKLTLFLKDSLFIPIPYENAIAQILFVPLSTAPVRLVPFPEYEAAPSTLRGGDWNGSTNRS